MLTNARADSPIGTYPQLQEQLHRVLLLQHPEWIEPYGTCPKCDEYDRRLMTLISFFRTDNHNALQATTSLGSVSANSAAT